MVSHFESELGWGWSSQPRKGLNVSKLEMSIKNGDQIPQGVWLRNGAFMDPRF